MTTFIDEITQAEKQAEKTIDHAEKNASALLQNVKIDLEKKTAAEIEKIKDIGQKKIDTAHEGTKEEVSKIGESAKKELANIKEGVEKHEKEAVAYVVENI